MIIVSTRGLYESTASTYTTTWDALVQHLATCAPSIEPVKEQVPLFNFAELQGGIKLEHVSQVHAAMLDYDKTSHEQMTQVLARAQQFRGFSYTTHSHGLDGMCRFRVALAFDRPCPTQQWDHVWHRLGRLLGVFHKKAPDTQTKDASRFFFLPAQNPAGPPCWFSSWDGPLLSLDELLKPDPLGNQEILIESEIEQSEIVGFSDVQHLATRLNRHNDPTLQMIARSLTNALRGEQYAAEGHRNDVTYKMAGELAKAFPLAHAEDLAEKFRASFELQGEPTCEQFASMLRRQQLKHQQYQAQKRIARGIMAQPQAELPADEGAYPYVVQRDGFYWMRMPGSLNYQQVWGSKDIKLAIERAYPQMAMGTDNKVMPIDQFASGYGSLVTAVEASYPATENRYDLATGRLTLATAPRRPLQPRHHPEIAEWLRLFGGDRHGDLVAWIAALFDFGRPLQALYLWGPSGTGKTLLPTGIAQLWEHPPTDFATVLQAFNSGMSRNPVILADEGLPKGLTTAQLRSFLITSTRSINEKFRPHFDLKGHVRLIVTANNPTAFSFRGDVENDDADAIANRVISIRTPKAAETYLESLGDVRAWVTEGKIAEHALWIAQQPRLACPGRWAMRPSRFNHEIRNSLAAPTLEWFIAWLASYIRNPREVEGRYSNPSHSWYVRTKAEQLLVSADAYRYAGEDIEPHAFQKALSFFAVGDRVKHRVPGDGARRIWYRSIDRQRFLEHANAYLDAEDIVNLLAQDTEERLESATVTRMRIVK